MANVVSSFTSIFTAIGEWFVTTFGDITALFYDPSNGLTFIGTLAIMNLGIAVVLLIINTIRRWIKLRG